MIVTNPILVKRRRSRRFNAPHQSSGDENSKRVIYRLEGDGADLFPRRVSDRLGGGVRPDFNRAEHGKALRRDLNAAFA